MLPVGILLALTIFFSTNVHYSKAVHCGYTNQLSSGYQIIASILLLFTQKFTNILLSMRQDNSI